MKVFYLNDTSRNVVVFRNTLNDFAGHLAPAEGRYFEIDMPEGCVPFIKVWENGSVLLSYCQADM